MSFGGVGEGGGGEGGAEGAAGVGRWGKPQFGGRLDYRPMTCPRCEVQQAAISFVPFGVFFVPGS